MAIGIFDSGVGGITILSKIRDVLPKQNLFFVADQAHVPYTEKSTQYLQDRAQIISKFFIENNCSTIVIACNTATVSTIKFLREEFPRINFVGVEPAIKPVAKTAKKDILVLATKHTLQSRRLKQLICTFASQKNIYLRSVPEWVILAESDQVDSQKAIQALKSHTKDIDLENISNIVLACTHYPYFVWAIKKLMPHVQIHNPSLPVANQVKKTYQKTGNTHENGDVFAYTTSQNLSAINLLHNLLPRASKIQSISL